MSPHSWLFSSLLLASSGLCELPAPANLSISSSGFMHILTWEPGPMSPSDLCYSVKVHIVINATWVRVPGCQCVQTPRSCNLTKTFSDVWGSYAVAVWAVLGDQSSSLVMLNTVTPVLITNPDPPLVSVSACGDNLCVKLKSPSDHLAHIYNKFTYILTIENGSNSSLTKVIEGLKDETLKNLDPGRNYCVTVSMKNRNGARSTRQCVYLSSVYKTEISVSLFLVAMLSVLVFTLVYCRRCSFRPTLPDILLTVKSVQMLPLPLDYDKPVFAWLVVSGAEHPRRHQMTDGSDSEEESEQNVKGEVYGTAGTYERRPEQHLFSVSQNDSSVIDSVTPHCAIKGSGNFLCPAPVPSDQVLFSDSRSLCEPLDDDGVISGSVRENGQILVDVSHLFSQVENAREQDCRLMSFLGLGRPELEEKDQNSSEVQEMECCSDVNLFSVTLGKYKEEDDEKQKNDNTLVSLHSPRECSVVPMEKISDSTEPLYRKVEGDLLGCSGYLRR